MDTIPTEQLSDTSHIDDNTNEGVLPPVASSGLDDDIVNDSNSFLYEINQSSNRAARLRILTFFPHDPDRYWLPTHKEKAISNLGEFELKDKFKYELNQLRKNMKHPDSELMGWRIYVDIVTIHADKLPTVHRTIHLASGGEEPAKNEAALRSEFISAKLSGDEEEMAQI